MQTRRPDLRASFVLFRLATLLGTVGLILLYYYSCHIIIVFVSVWLLTLALTRLLLYPAGLYLGPNLHGP
jgi:hypothetical protein